MKKRLFKIMAISFFIGAWLGALGVLVLQVAQKQRQYEEMQIRK